MKKILLAGQECDETNELFMRISKHFEVKQCEVEYDLFQGVNKLFKPDLIILSFINYAYPDNRFFDLLADKNRRMPMLTVGMEVVDPFFEKSHTGSDFSNIKKNTSWEEILDTIFSELGVEAGENENASSMSGRATAKPRILVVDDFAMILRQIRLMLKDHFDVRVATSAVQAMSAIGRIKPDLILMDYAMPDCNGKKIFEVLHMNEETKDIPVIFLTGVSDHARVEEILSLKPAGYLLKPPEKNRLIEIIYQVLNDNKNK